MGVIVSQVVQRAKKLRKESTEAEKLLWHQLRLKQLKNFKFRRQAPIGNYIVDFACYDPKIIIEIDGGQHFENTKDRVRDQWLNRQGFSVLRFWNSEVFENLNGVLEKILSHCSHPPLTPPIEGGEV